MPGVPGRILAFIWMELLDDDVEGQFRFPKGDRVELEGSRSLGLQRSAGGLEGCKNGTVLESQGLDFFDSNRPDPFVLESPRPRKG